MKVKVAYDVRKVTYSQVLPYHYQFEPLQGKGDDDDSHQDDSENEEDLSRQKLEKKEFFGIIFFPAVAL